MEERSEELWHEKARQLGIVVIIPTYNNEKTLTTVIEDVLFYVEDIIVVNDGSTDSTPTLLPPLLLPCLYRSLLLQSVIGH